MDLRTALKEQFHAGLAMLAECVENCPDDMWTAGVHPRTYWRIVFHAAFFTHLGIGQDEAAFLKWPNNRPDMDRLWTDPAYLEPYEMDEGVVELSRAEMLDYIRFVDSLVDSNLSGLDLDTDDSGFRWYDDISKLSNVLMNLRHIQGHVGQLSELLMARGIDIDWVAKA